MSDLKLRKQSFLDAASFAVIGASEDPAKFGHRVFAAYLRHGRKAFPVNPHSRTILGHDVFPNLAALPESAEAVSVITPPSVTEKVMDEVIASGAKHVWLQPGAESAEAVRKAEAAGLNVLAGGPCVLVEMERQWR